MERILHVLCDSQILFHQVVSSSFKAELFYVTQCSMKIKTRLFGDIKCSLIVPCFGKKISKKNHTVSIQLCHRPADKHTIIKFVVSQKQLLPKYSIRAGGINSRQCYEVKLPQWPAPHHFY